MLWLVQGYVASFLRLNGILTVVAMVTRISSPINGGTRLKTPALFADAGEIHETVKKLLAGNGDRKALIDKVESV